MVQGGELDGGTQGAGAVIRVGPVQKLEFVEEKTAKGNHDGHHICVYVTPEGENCGEISGVCLLCHDCAGCVHLSESFARVLGFLATDLFTIYAARWALM